MPPSKSPVGNKLAGAFWLLSYFRLFAFWDKTDKSDTVVISTHGLIKKRKKFLRAKLNVQKN